MSAENMNTEFRLNYDSNKHIEDLEKQFTGFKNRLQCIGNITCGDKLSRGSDKLYYIHTKDMMFNGVRRWWTSQSRDKIVEYLKEDFESFMNFLDGLLRLLQLTYSSRVFDLSENILELVNRIIFGLYNLKETYPGEKKVICQVDSIILTLIDFKANLNECKHHRTNIICRERHNSE